MSSAGASPEQRREKNYLPKALLNYVRLSVVPCVLGLCSHDVHETPSSVDIVCCDMTNHAFVHPICSVSTIPSGEVMRMINVHVLLVFVLC